MEIKLRPLMEKDAEGMQEWMTDPTITCFFRFDASRVTRESCLAFIQKSANEEHTKHFAIVNEHDDYLGTVSLKNIDLQEKRAEYAISVRKCAQGTGAAFRGTEQVLAFAFGPCGLETVYLNVLAVNTRANHFYRKVGFRYLRCEKNALTIADRPMDLNWYEIRANQM